MTKVSRRPRHNRLNTIGLAATGAALATQIANKFGGIKFHDNLQGSENTRDAARNAITAQHDIGRAYYHKSKKRVSQKAKKRRGKQKKFKKKIRTIIAGSSPTYHYNERATAPVSMSAMPTVWSTSPSQQTLGTALNGNCKFRLFSGCNLDGTAFSNGGTTDIGRYMYNAIGKIYTRYNAGDLIPGALSLLETYKCVVKHCAVNFTIVSQQAVPISVDVYEFVATRDIGVTDSYSTPGVAMSQINGTDANNLTNNMSNTINKTDFGATPWDFPGLKNSWKVLSKTTIYLQSLGQTNLQFTGPRGFWGGSKVNTTCSLKGKTREYFFVVGGRIAAGLDNVTAPIKVYWEKTYKFKPPAGHTWATEGVLSAQSYSY